MDSSERSPLLGRGGPSHGTKSSVAPSHHNPTKTPSPGTTPGMAPSHHSPTKTPSPGTTPGVAPSDHNLTKTPSPPPSPHSPLHSEEEEVDGVRTRRDTDPPDQASLNLPQHRVYPTRFWILSVFAFMACFQCLQWNTWGPLSDSVDEAFQGWGSQTVAMMANWGTITFVIFVVPMCWLVNAKGLRVGVLTCTALLAIGTVIRVIPLFTSSDTFFTVMAHVCAICVGIPGTIVMAAPPLIASAWFPPKERTTATAVSLALNLLGSGVSYTEPLVVRAPSPSTTPQEIRADIKLLLSIWAGIAVTLFMVVLAYFPDQPPSSPSRTSHIQRPNFKDSIKDMMGNRNLLLVMVAYGVCIGVPAAWLSVLNYSLLDLGLLQDDAMWVGLAGVLMSVVSALVVGRLTDLMYGYVKLSLVLTMIANMICFYWVFLLTWGSITVTKWQIYASVVGGLSFNSACNPLFFELAVEVSYPCPEVIVGGLITGFNNFIGLLFLFIFFIPNIGYQWVTYLLVGASAISIVPVMFVKEEYSRSSIDRNNLRNSPYSAI